LKKRVTIIPLDKIHAGKPLDQRTVQQAKQLVGNTNTDSMKNCVSVHPEFEKVRDFCFNGVLVAKNNTMAHDLCFNRAIMTKVIFKSLR
jgi:chromosome segregation ATPase